MSRPRRQLFQGDEGASERHHDISQQNLTTRQEYDERHSSRLLVDRCCFNEAKESNSPTRSQQTRSDRKRPWIGHTPTQDYDELRCQDDDVLSKSSRQRPDVVLHTGKLFEWKSENYLLISSSRRW